MEIQKVIERTNQLLTEDDKATTQIYTIPNPLSLHDAHLNIPNHVLNKL